MSLKSASRRSVTRGDGLLEPVLSQLRARQANRLIPSHLRAGRILDIGCGSLPLFLKNTAFDQKYAIDQLIPHELPPGVVWKTMNLNQERELPFEANLFSVVTMLAVAEHIKPDRLQEILTEVRRVLVPGGKLIITTPASWTDGILRTLAKLGLVSSEEIDEHVSAYTLALLAWQLGSAGFPMDGIRLGYFECFMNLWASAQK